MDAEGDELRRLLERLTAAGLASGTADVCDVLWLAAHLTPDQAVADPPGGGRPPTGDVGGKVQGGGGAASAEEPVGLVQLTPGPGPRSRSIVRRPEAEGAAGGSGEEPAGYRRGADVAVPRARVLPDPLALARALRPLRRYRGPRPRPDRELDVEATVESIARTRLPQFVFRRAERKDTVLRLVMDGSPSVFVWQELLRELAEVCRHVGAFREVRLVRTHTGTDGEIRLDGSRALSGRNVLALVLSDCTGANWRTGAMQRLLARLAAEHPVALLQPLPQRLWPRTRFPTEPCDIRREPGAPAGLRVRPLAVEPAAVRRVGVPVPVLDVSPQSLGNWARLLTGEESVRAAVAWADPAPAAPPRERTPGGNRQGAVERLTRFRRSASPQAYELAVYLSAAPLWLPVMQLVQWVMLPKTGPAELAEVLLGGLVRWERDWRDGQWYDFLPGVREALQEPLSRNEAKLVLKHLSDFVTRQFGRSERNFPAMALARLQGEPEGVGAWPPEAAPTSTAVPEPFAVVSAQLVSRYLAPERTPATTTPVVAEPGPVDPGQPMTLPQLVQELRGLERAMARPGETDARARLLADAASVRWQLWQLQGQRLELERALEDAAEAVDLAAVLRDPVLGRRTRLLHARVAGVCAELQEAAGAHEQAALLLDTVSANLHPLAGPQDPEASRVRAEALYRLGGLREDRTALEEADQLLRAVAGAVSPQAPAEFAAQRGLWARVLLRLAEWESEPAYTAEAAERLREALAVLPASEEQERFRAQLDLAAALGEVDGPGPEGAEDDEALAVIAQALRLAPDNEAEARAWEAAGDRYTARAGGAGGAAGVTAALRQAVHAYERALGRRRHDDPARVRLLLGQGEALLRLVAATGAEDLVLDAVRVLRLLLSERPELPPSRSRRQLLLAQVLLARSGTAEDTNDLLEAEALAVSAALRSAADPLVAAEAWLLAGTGRGLLHRATGREELLQGQLDAFGQAQEAAQQQAGAIAHRLLAQATHRRGQVRELLGDSAAALNDYRLALRNWELSGDSASPDAVAARMAVERLVG